MLIVEIMEVEQRPDDDTIKYFANENCASFAYALWLADNKSPDGQFVLFSDPNDNGYSDFHEDAFTHVLYSNSHGMWDVRGHQTPQDVEEHYYGYFSGNFDPDFFWGWAVGMTDDKPLYGDQRTVEEALDTIRRFPHLYLSRLSRLPI